MTIEIHEVVVQARVTESASNDFFSPLASDFSDERWDSLMEAVVRRVLKRLSEEQGGRA